ncbi:MAG TPA: SDR family oxidoreductase [Verrucomicrobiae bacterium]|nr:SDR family oxidoreductase [Verrucomicrobiae bacterium]
MRVLIVGCGYVGLPLGVELVRLGHEVFGLRRNPASETELKTAGIQPLFANITQPDSLKDFPRDFDWVVNCASSGGGDADAYRKTYLDGNRNLVAWLENAPPKKFIYTSSTGVYAQNDGSQIKESSPAEPEIETGKILIEAEKFLLGAFQQKKFPVAILRVAGIYGPKRGRKFKQFLKNEAVMEGDGSRLMNMIHRNDVVGCIITTLKSGRAGEIYNAVDDEPVSQRTFFEWLGGTVGKYPPPSGPENADENRKRGVTNKRVSNRKLKMELGYQFQYPNFRKGYTAEIQRLSDAGMLQIEPDVR